MAQLTQQHPTFSSDLTFITNENGRTLKERFEGLMEHTEAFDCVVGYFFVSGFHLLYKSLESSKKIRILIGMGTDSATSELIRQAEDSPQGYLAFSHMETKELVEKSVSDEMGSSEDSRNIEEGIRKFVEWIRTGKLEIKAYPSQHLHAKVYIMTFSEKDIDKGRVVTGSSNFSRSGLFDNLEFNVELKNRSDYDFAIAKFSELWKDAVDVGAKYVETLQTNTWLNDTISPYDLYLKFLYEYFQDELSQTNELFLKYLPENFKRLEYQEQAVLNAKKILEAYGGVFISDVVGLGKTYMAAMLADQLNGRTLVIAPPILLDRNNPGSWPNVFSDFKVAADYESVGKLDAILAKGVEKYQNVIVDEAHRFRTESNVTYEMLAQICRKKQVILVTATPYNNSPLDILSQIKLFQNSRRSTIPGVPNLERFFEGLQKRLARLDRQKDYAEYIETSKANAKEIRDKVLKHLMVRRTRSEILKYFGRDLKHQGLKFPEVEKPEPFLYKLNAKEDDVFTKTISLVAQDFKYARYTPILYYTGRVTQSEQLSQRNMGKFMKILLVKRLESSFYAFRNTIDRFVGSYEKFLREFRKGDVYVSKRYTSKIFEFLESGYYEGIERLIEEGKAEKYRSDEFRPEFRIALEDDLKVLRKIQELWQTVHRDPKLLTFIEKLTTNPILKKNKLIIFTESKETAEYLSVELEGRLSEPVLCFTGGSEENIREKVIENFDARVRHQKDDYRIMVSTEVLSEGVNLHRANVVINYDIPWNPTRMMQRVGRINRVDTPHKQIHTFNFFPTIQANNEIKLREAAEAKINAFLTLLGGDAQLLTEGEPIGSHELFNLLLSKAAVTGEEDGEESELKYLNVIREIREKEPEVFERIKKLPKKARTARESAVAGNSLLTYFRTGKLEKFFICAEGAEPQELDFISAAKTIEANAKTDRVPLSPAFYRMLDENKRAFAESTVEEAPVQKPKGGRDTATHITRIVKALSKTKQFTDEQDEYLRTVLSQLEEGGFPRQTLKETLKALNSEMKSGFAPMRLLGVLQTKIPARLLESHLAENVRSPRGPREVILSENLYQSKLNG